MTGRVAINSRPSPSNAVARNQYTLPSSSPEIDSESRPLRHEVWTSR
jgi:hypothetical protein